jgi:hypothetical protein
MATLAILGFRGLGVALVVVTRFVISVAILVVLAWRIAIVLAMILMMPLIRPITISVLVVSFLMIDAVGGFVPVPMTRFLSLIIFLGLLLTLHDLGIHSAVHIGLVAAFKELLKFEYVFFDYSVLICILDMMRLWLSKESFFA